MNAFGKSLHKLRKTKSLSLAQHYLLLSMPLDRSFGSFVYCSFLHNVHSFHIPFYYSGHVLRSHHMYSRYSGPAMKCTLHTHPRYSGPARMHAVPVWMPPCSRDPPHIPTTTLEKKNFANKIAFKSCFQQNPPPPPPPPFGGMRRCSLLVMYN